MMLVLLAGVVDNVTTDLGGIVDVIINPDVFLVVGIVVVGLIIWAAVRPKNGDAPWRRR